ncbi:hypothetical protein D3C81_1872160 [compost metagenome]
MRELPGTGNPAQIPFDQRDLSAVHRDISAGAHSYAHIGFGQRRRIVDAIARHGDHGA